MSYTGRQPIIGNFRKLDNIATSFNGVLTTFPLTVSAAAVVPGSPQNLTISISGVIQEPGSAYTLSGSNIIFSGAPLVTDTFFGIMIGDVGTVNVPADGSVTAAKLDATLTTTIAGKVEGVAASVDSELMLFSGTTGKASKRATLTGLVKATAGVPSAAAAGTDYVAPVGNDSQLTRQMLVDCGLVFVDKGNSGTALQTLDYTAANHQKITATGAFTIATSNWPPSGNLGVILLEAVNFGSQTVTWPTINWVLPNGTTTTSVSTWLAAITGRTAFQTSGIDWIKIWTRDAGATIYGGFAA